jgi:hypothetical protein
MKQNRLLLMGAALVVMAALVLGACGGKKGGGRAAPASDFSYELARDGDLEWIKIIKYTGRGGKVVIPEEIEGYDVGEIGIEAFAGSWSSSVTGYHEGTGDAITEVVIPRTVFIIGHRAFSHCSNLTKVSIGRTYVVVGALAFVNCENLSELIIPDKNDNPEIGANVLAPEYNKLVGAVGSDAFNGCKKLPLKMRERLKAMGFIYF